MNLRAGIFGYPLGHSISPAFQQAAFDHLGIDAIYEAWETPPEKLGHAVASLRSGDFMAGFAHTANVGYGIVAEPIWQDPLVIALPARHELLAHKKVPLHTLGGHPLIMCDPQACEGCCLELARLLRQLEHEPNIVEHASSLDMMLTLVGAGYGIGFTTTTRITAYQRSDVVIRPLAVESAVITTYLLWPENTRLSVPLEQFIARLRDRLSD